jgi:hypothetical protein
MMALDDYCPAAPIPIPTAVKAAIMVPELGAGAAKSIAITEMVTADANADAKILSTSYVGAATAIVARAASARLSFLMFHPLVAAQEKTVEQKACSESQAAVLMNRRSDHLEVLCSGLLGSSLSDCSRQARLLFESQQSHSRAHAGDLNVILACFKISPAFIIAD